MEQLSADPDSALIASSCHHAMYLPGRLLFAARLVFPLVRRIRILDRSRLVTPCAPCWMQMTDPPREPSGKIVLMIMLFMFTFVTMVGGNPLKDAYGFRYWKNPGPISEYYGTGHSAQLRAFLASILGAAFAVAGPDMLSLIVSLTGISLDRCRIRQEQETEGVHSLAVCRGYQPPKSLAGSFQECLCPTDHLVRRSPDENMLRLDDLAECIRLQLPRLSSRCRYRCRLGGRNLDERCSQRTAGCGKVALCRRHDQDEDWGFASYRQRRYRQLYLLGVSEAPGWECSSAQGTFVERLFELPYLHVADLLSCSELPGHCSKQSLLQDIRVTQLIGLLFVAAVWLSMAMRLDSCERPTRTAFLIALSS
jgi:hypothetical protein